MNLPYFTTRFANNADVIRSLVQDVGGEQAHWRPDPDSWSLLEVLNHLYDEEREDFRIRLDLLLNHPGQPWPGIDPTAWVIGRKYNERNLEISLHNFLEERRRSISWLESLSDPNWQAVQHHPQAGALTAADMLSSWLAHDFLHIRQLNELHFKYHAQLMQPHRVDYAGGW